MRGYAHQNLKNAMRAASLCLGACLLISCATPPKSSQIATTSDHLTLRNLADGDCGLFIWVGESLNFLLFVEGNTEAQFLKDKTEIDLIPTEQLSAADPYGQFPKQTFTDKSGQIYTLDLTDSKEVLDSIRYTRGLWSTKDKEGWDVVKAAYGYSSCLNKARRQTPHPVYRTDPLPDLFYPAPTPSESITISPSLSEPQITATPQVTGEPSYEVLSPPPNLSPNPPIETIDNGITVQLSSERTPLKAEDRWLKITEKHPLLLSFTKRIEEADLAEKGVFYRVRIGGFQTRQEALSLCKRLKDMKQDCFVPR